MEYRVVTGQTPQEIEAEVKRLIQRGWRPLGGVAIVGGADYKLLQAMIRTPERDRPQAT